MNKQLLINLDWGKTDYYGIYSTLNRDNLIEYLKSLCLIPNPDYVLCILAPCGEQVLYKTWDDIPDKDVKCPCNNPKPWLIKYEPGHNPKHWLIKYEPSKIESNE